MSAFTEAEIECLWKTDGSVAWQPNRRTDGSAEITEGKP
jgi:hypothetical protein